MAFGNSSEVSTYEEKILLIVHNLRVTIAWLIFNTLISEKILNNCTCWFHASAQ